MTEQKQRLTARRKLELYKETRPEDANLGEILRRYGVHTNDLRRIEALVEAAALEALKVRHNGQAPAGVSGVSGSAVENDHLVAKAGVKVIGLAQDWRDGTTQGCACPVRALATQNLLWPSPRQHHT